MKIIFIDIKNVSKIYTMGEEKVIALNNINLGIKRENVVCLLGTSGSGKSTLLNLIAGLEKPTKGEIYIGKIPIHLLSEDQVTVFRKKNIGFVFQSYNLLKYLTALENVTFSLMLKGYKKEEREHMAVEMLKEVGLETRMDHKPSEMSGGQQQRVAIARAFVDRPKIIFADEPTGNLDTKTSEEIMDLTLQMASEYKQTLIIVSHDPNTSNYCDDTVRLRDGEIIS